MPVPSLRPPRSSPRRPAGRRRFAARALALCLAAAAAACGRDAASPADAVDVATARAELEAGRAVLIDLREPAEHASGVAAGAALLPISRLRDRLGEIPTDPSRPVLLICQTQGRSRAALETLRRTGGYAHVRYVEGGMSEWARRGWPMVTPPR